MFCVCCKLIQRRPKWGHKQIIVPSEMRLAGAAFITRFLTLIWNKDAAKLCKSHVFVRVTWAYGIAESFHTTMTHLKDSCTPCGYVDWIFAVNTFQFPLDCHCHILYLCPRFHKEQELYSVDRNSIQILVRKTYSPLTLQEIPPHLFNSKVLCRVHKILSLQHVLNTLNAVHVLIFWIFKICFIVRNIVAYRPVAGKRPRDKQTGMFALQKLEAATDERCFCTVSSELL
jgi:hypothetical protein